MSIFLRQWLAPSPPVVFNPLAIGVAFLVNVGYGGPVAGDAPSGIRGITAPFLQRWPPIGLTPSTPQRHVLRQVLGSARGLDDAALAGLATSLEALAKRTDNSRFKAQFHGQADAPLASNGICLAPALVAGDTVVESSGESIRMGDIASVVLRGTLVPLTKVFAGIINREGFPSALFYLKHPEQLIEVPLSDVLYARKIRAPREYDGHALLADADPFVAKWRERYDLVDSMEPVGTTRTAAWVESMTSIFDVLRGQPE